MARMCLLITLYVTSECFCSRTTEHLQGLGARYRPFLRRHDEAVRILCHELVSGQMLLQLREGLRESCARLCDGKDGLTQKPLSRIVCNKPAMTSSLR